MLNSPVRKNKVQATVVLQTTVSAICLTPATKFICMAVRCRLSGAQNIYGVRKRLDSKMASHLGGAENQDPYGSTRLVIHMEKRDKEARLEFDRLSETHLPIIQSCRPPSSDSAALLP